MSRRLSREQLESTSDFGESQEQISDEAEQHQNDSGIVFLIDHGNWLEQWPRLHYFAKPNFLDYAISRSK